MKTKQVICLILSLIVLLSIFAGCQAKPEAVADAPAADVPAQEPEPSQTQTAPEPETPAPQLSETLQQVYDLGLADLDLLQRAEDECTRAEAVSMLAKAYELRNGEKSLYLHDMASAFDADFLSESSTRYYFAQALYYSAMETGLPGSNTATQWNGAAHGRTLP